MKRSINSIVQGRNSPSVSSALRRVITDTFSCHVCGSILRPLVILLPLHLGCQQCVDMWYIGDEGRNKRCPRCRADHGSAETCQLYGLDEFLCSITQLLAYTQEELTLSLSPVQCIQLVLCSTRYMTVLNYSLCFNMSGWTASDHLNQYGQFTLSLL